VSTVSVRLSLLLRRCRMLLGRGLGGSALLGLLLGRGLGGSALLGLLLRCGLGGSALLGLLLCRGLGCCALLGLLLGRGLASMRSIGLARAGSGCYEPPVNLLFDLPGVRPDIADDLGRKREDAAVLVEREFRVDDFVEPMTRRGKILQPVACPAHRPTEVTGEHRDHLPPKPPPTSGATINLPVVDCLRVGHQTPLTAETRAEDDPRPGSFTSSGFQKAKPLP
jgi:hypothetical protein